MTFAKPKWRRVVTAMIIGLSLEILIFVGVSLASPPSYIEPGQIDSKLFEWVHQPSFSVAVAVAPVAPAFFENLRDGYLAVAVLQAAIYAAAAYVLFRYFGRDRVARL